ncbi:proline dehydrogenase family protein [Parafrigoribacterium mesophilum]|uniref:proline dehydrogenase family protein n=1 Tax=Parafrigoribacterium mesophilum TaxID=433646 RepID=UPI0031FD5253
MTNDLSTAPVIPAGLADEAIDLASTWAKLGADDHGSRSAKLLAKALKDQHGLDFTVGFVDRVVRPEDLTVAARNLSLLARNTPAFLPWYMRIAVRVGGAIAPTVPWAVVPVARRVLRGMVGHLIVDARPDQLGAAIAKLKKPGIRLNLNLLGEAVLGEAEAARRLEGTRAMLARPDVDYVSIKVSSIVSQLSMWAFDETVQRVVTRLTPLYELAAASASPKFINLDMEEYRDLDLTMAVFRGILDQPQLLNLEAGIVLQAYLPDALGAFQALTQWSTQRVARGGAPIKVRVVKGANLAMEHVDAAVHGWPLATYPSKQDTDTNYLRVLDWAMRPEHTAAVRVGIAGHNLFDIAFAHLLSQQRGVASDVEFEMLLGMAEGQADAVRKAVGGLLLYTPVVRPQEFDVAISYLVRRLEENASQDNFMSAVFELAHNQRLMDREKSRFLASLAQLDGTVPASNRTQNRTAAASEFSSSVLEPVEVGRRPEPVEGFHNTSDTDPALPANRAWGRSAIEASAASALGVDIIAAAGIDSPDQLDTVITTAREAGKSWAALGGAGRAQILRRAAVELESSRAKLIEVMANETGKTIAEGDPEVTEAIDFAGYYASLAPELDAVDGARYTPSALTVVTPPWNFPVAIPAGSTLAALAAGSPVIIKPAKLSQRSGAVMIDALWRAGVPRDVLQLVDLRDRDLGQRLISDPRVERVILTGGYETAQMFRSWRPELPLLAETSGKNAIIVTPSADIDLAVSDVVKSAFGHAGQKCSAASLVILVGSAARSQRFERQLVDAVTSMRVGYPSDPTTQMGPIIEPAKGKLKDALTTLDSGERWLLQPKQLDDSGRLWSPGIRTGVADGSYFHLTEFFGPVLGVMRAATLDEAIRLQNASAYGLTAGLHSLDAEELRTWLNGVEAGNLYVNRGITGAIVRRQPFGGWKRSSVGAGTKAGGPNYLVHLGSWEPAELSAVSVAAPLTPRISELLAAAEGDLQPAELERVRRAAASDQSEWEREFGTAKDVSGLGLERNLFRYLPIGVTVRLADGADLVDLVRMVAAGLRAGAPVHVSTSLQPSPKLLAVLQRHVASVAVEPDRRWLERAVQGGILTSRVRLIGGDAYELSAAVKGDPDLAIYADPVTSSGRIELLPFLREQAVSITAHRFGNPDDWSAAVI